MNTMVMDKVAWWRLFVIVGASLLYIDRIRLTRKQTMVGVHSNRMGKVAVSKRWKYGSRWTLILLFALFMPAGLTQGISDQPGPVPSGQQGLPSEEEGKYVPPIQVTFVRETGEDLQRMIEQLPGESMADNRWTRLYEEELGIQIRYDWIATGDVYNQKLGVALASGRFPDIVKVNPYQLRQLSNAGWIEDLTEVYRTQASPLTKKYWRPREEVRSTPPPLTAN